MRLKEIVHDSINLGSKIAFFGLSSALAINALEYLYDTPLLSRTYSFEECLPALSCLGISYCLSEMTEKENNSCGRIN